MSRWSFIQCRCYYFLVRSLTFCWNFLFSGFSQYDDECPSEFVCSYGVCCRGESRFYCYGGWRRGIVVENYQIDQKLAWAPSRFSARSHGPSRKRRLNSFAINAVQWRLTFQTAVRSTRRNRSFNPPCFRLLACVKCSVLHLQQSRWVLLCTHVCRWHFNRFNTDSGQHEMCPLRFLSVLSSAKNAS